MLSKEKAVDIICSSATIYNNIMNDKNLLIVMARNGSDSFSNISIINIAAKSRHFLHLTGVQLNNGLTADIFFQKSLSDDVAYKLSENDFEFKDGTTELKLDTIKRTLMPSKNFKTAGVYNQKRPNLNTEYLIGSRNSPTVNGSSLGFIKPTASSGFYIPNTLLNGNIYDDIDAEDRLEVLAVLKKDIHEYSYNEIKYLAKDIFIHKLFEMADAELKRQFPDLSIDIDYQNQLKSSQLAKEKEYMQKAEIAELAGELCQTRSNYLKDSENMDLLERYDTMQNNFVLKAKEYDMYDYAESFLNQQKTVSKSSEVVEYIDSDIQALKRAFGFTMRSADIVQNVYADFPEANPAAAHKALFALPMPPEHPFKALWIKAREIVRNIAGSLRRTEKTPDKTVQAEKIEPTDNTEKDDLIILDIYNMSVKNQNDYMEFVNTSKAIGEIELQTGLLFEQTAAQEHFIQPEKVQVEVKRKSENFEYGD